MGWFGKKKVPKVPLPQGHVLDENALKVPSGPRADKVIKPQAVKEAIDFEREFKLPEPAPLPKPKSEIKVAVPTAPKMPMELEEADSMDDYGGPLYIKVDVYQRVLGEVDEIKHGLSELQKINRQLEQSEYNEENDFHKLKKSVRAMHDRLLQADKILFKG